ncbi:uncharacterized protein LOC108114990 isoform X2 [Drosophila eugracilis]|uniref:uncharacterized protein LOC108114990 isoform X2 n=1 Tax=Drosophila eugracilis TaxID=29029 RepID=UPI0007E8A536|nr:uncharacterized protein LOC108114990 isoform X2 [Drosophila eugracilis]
MVTRTCVYKDCEYYYFVHDNSQKKSRTLFAFPKQQERARIWHINGKVHPKIPQTQLFMCSSHFDRKFISSTKNRTVLVGEAVPYPYEDSEPDAEEETQQVASTSHESYYINMSDDELSINNVDTTTSNKTKIEHFDIESTPAKRQRESVRVPSVKETSKAEPVPTAEPADESIDIEAIDTSEVSVFNFKGQEYVQMSMEYYLKEKRKMTELLHNYKKALKSIKAHVTQLDL